MMRCVYCGQMLDDKNKFCPVCGNKVDEENAKHIESLYEENISQSSGNGYSFNNANPDGSEYNNPGSNNSEDNYYSNNNENNYRDNNIYSENNYQNRNYNNGIFNQNINIYSGEKRWNVFAIAGFIFAVLANWLCLIFCSVALAQVKIRNQKGKGLAIAGLVIYAAYMVIVSYLIYTHKIDLNAMYATLYGQS